MEEAYLSRWRGSFGMVEDDLVCVARSSRDEKERTGRMDLTVFEFIGEAWKRTDVSLVQRWYPESAIREGLRNAGLKGIRTTGGDDPKLEGLPDYSGRMFFVARKLDKRNIDNAQ